MKVVNVVFCDLGFEPRQIAYEAIALPNELIRTYKKSFMEKQNFKKIEKW